jgi:23S rRNA (uracil1939-C5)-methyltransferase
MKQKRDAVTAQIFDLKIERIVPNGLGIAFAENLTFFVPLVASGDKVRVFVEKQTGKIAFASVVEILEPSPHRVEPPCPYFGTCGGCDFQQLNYQSQLAAKLEIIRDCLRRIGKIEWQREIKIYQSPDEWRYRTRAQWKREKSKLGYFKRSSHRVCDVAECPILTRSLQETLTDLRRESAPRDFAEAKAVAANQKVSLKLELAENSTDFDENFYAANTELAETNRSASAVSKLKSDEISLTIGGFTYFFSADVFFQVNHALLPQFVETAIATSAARGRTALDLYCGVGLFSLPLGEKFARVVGVEGSAASINFAERNASNANLENLQFEIGFVGDWLEKNAENLNDVDFVLLDPPRSGAEKETLSAIKKLNPPQICYVSCNPATLARDLRILLENEKYKIEKIDAFDFFPQTHHVETVVGLSRFD